MGLAGLFFDASRSARQTVRVIAHLTTEVALHSVCARRGYKCGTVDLLRWTTFNVEICGLTCRRPSRDADGQDAPRLYVRVVGYSPYELLLFIPS